MTEFEARLAQKIQDELRERHEEAEECRKHKVIAELIAGAFMFATLVCGAGIETASSIPFQVILTLLMLSCSITAYLVAMGWKAAVEELEERDPWAR